MIFPTEDDILVQQTFYVSEKNKIYIYVITSLLFGQFRLFQILLLQIKFY